MPNEEQHNLEHFTSLPHADGYAKFFARLQQEPSAVIQQLRELWANKPQGAYSLELHILMYWFAYAFQSYKELSDATWLVLVKDENLAGLYMQLIQSRRFFDEEPVRFLLCVAHEPVC